jgi:Cd2+/Zn2+-exporting ATPase
MKKCCDEPNGSPAAIKAADRAIETQVSYDGNTDSGLEIPSASCCNTGKDSMLDAEVAPCCGPGTQAQSIPTSLSQLYTLSEPDSSYMEPKSSMTSIERAADGCCFPSENVESKCCAASESTDPSDAPYSQSSQDVSFNTFHISQMCCPTEQAMIEGKLGKMAGVEKLEFNMMKKTLGVWHTLADTSAIGKAISSLGMTAEQLDMHATTKIRVAQLDCSAEESLIRAKLKTLTGVEGLEFNIPQRTVSIAHQPQALDEVLEAIRGLGMSAEVVEDGSFQPVPADQKTRWWPLIVAGVSAVGAEILHLTSAVPEWFVAMVALISIAICGPATYKKGWISIRHLNLNINALMSIAVTGAVLIGQWPEAAMVMFLFTVAELIEAKSLDRARNAIQGLMSLSPDRVTVRQADGQWEEVDAKTVGIGDLVRARPGERIGLDGELESGHSTVNQAPITGESMPIEKAQGDKVYAGSINEAGAFEYRVTAKANNTTLARIIHAVEEAQGSRAPTQRFVDQFAKYYTPAIFFFALAVAVIPPIFMGGAWFDWVYRALVLLVVACPCALVISTPVSIVSGLAAAARKGILVKGGIYLEIGAKIDYVALDKTGTITHGKPVLTDFSSVSDHPEADLRMIAASLGNRSDHPVSLAIARDQDLTLAKPVDDFSALPGKGIKGSIDGNQYHLGNLRLLEELGLSHASLESKVTALEKQGKTVVVLSDSSGALAIFSVADTVKQSSQKAIEELHKLGVKTVMLTGDNPHTAAAIAQAVGIDQAKGSLLPSDKLSAIESLQSDGHVVGMVGDGINDAPALAKSQIGFAMAAAGTDTAIETADVALMDDDLRKIPAFIRLSRQTASILKQNIVFALGVKAVFLVFTLAGIATMWMAVFADVGVSVLVVLNGLRLLKK